LSGCFAPLSNSERDKLRRENQPDFTAPMLATLIEDYFDDPSWIFERKFDGERVLAFRSGDSVRLMSRNKKELGDTYPEIQEALEAQECDDFIVDGEVVAFDGNVTSFSRLQRRMQVKDREEARSIRVAVYYYVFDILYLGGCRLDELPLRSRKGLLRRALDYDNRIRFTPHRNESGQAYHKAACQKGWEGIIAKRADSAYRHGRSQDWLKFKCVNGQELVIGGFTEPHGSRKGFGALLVGYYEDDDLRYAGKVGTGYDEETLIELRERMDGLERQSSPFADEVREKRVHWITPKLVGEFGFTEWTGDGKLRHPRFLGLRRDKPASKVIRERPES
jgi:bifunctional non-homologous end joining protein LigD